VASASEVHRGATTRCAEPGEAVVAHHIGAPGENQSPLELELELDDEGAGVLAGAGVEELLLLSPPDDAAAGVLVVDDELSEDAGFDDELEPLRLSVL
jgi:hypothetical protein